MRCASPAWSPIFTGSDLDLKSLPAALPAKGRGGTELINPGRPALAKGRVRFTGDAVALIVAESAVAAQDAAELVAVEYRDLPAVVSTHDALAAGAPLVHDCVPGNIVLDYESGDEAGAREAFEKSGAGDRARGGYFARRRQPDGAARLPRCIRF